MPSPRTNVSTFIRFIISGGLSSLLQIALLEASVSFLAWEPVRASAITYVITLVVNFGLQKFWSFGERDISRTYLQLFQFACIGLVNLGINTLLMYLFTYEAGLPYVLSQILTLPVIAISSYITYRFVIFKIRQ